MVAKIINMKMIMWREPLGFATLSFIIFLFSLKRSSVDIWQFFFFLCKSLLSSVPLLHILPSWLALEGLGRVLSNLFARRLLMFPHIYDTCCIFLISFSICVWYNFLYFSSWIILADSKNKIVPLVCDEQNRKCTVLLK